MHVLKNTFTGTEKKWHESIEHVTNGRLLLV